MKLRTSITSLTILIIAFGAFQSANAQKFTIETGTISFFSDAPAEDISAQNSSVGSLFDASTSEIVFMVPIKDFQFDKRLMREHFNEKYMETHKFPKSSFKGQVDGFDLKKTGIQSVKTSGKLTIHGVTREVLLPGTIEMKEGKLNVKSKFKIKLADYNISVPQIVWQNIADEIDIQVEFIYKPL